MSRIMITGMGVISAIGDSAAENRNSLQRGEGGITQLENYPSRYAGVFPCGEIKQSTEALNERWLRLSDPSLTRTSVLALIAAREAVQDSRLTAEQLTATDTALIGASTVGGMCLTDELYRDAREKTAGSPYLSSYDAASVTLAVQKYFSLSGEVSTINTACSSSANAIIAGAKMIRFGFARRAIVGGSDSLAKFTINGFHALNILSPDLCAPFDDARRGLNLGEGAGFLVLENESDAAGKKNYGFISGYGNSNDAYHPSSTSPDGAGPYGSMLQALESAGLRPAAIGYVNAHGTGTENNDETESTAMIRLFGNVPPFASTKSFTGHTLGAAGSIGAIYALLGLQEQAFYPSLRFRKPISATGLTPVTTYTRAAYAHVMSNSFGFGGNCSSLVFSKS